MTISQHDLRRRLDGIRNLPTLPDVYHKVQTIIRNPNSSASDVGRVVAEDPALTARILKMVNSAFYGLRREVATIDQAVVVLGLRELEHVVLATSVLKVFPGRGAQAQFNLREYWKHALGSAIAARAIARQLGIGDPNEAFTMGLLHSIGKLVLDLFFFDEYVNVLNKVQESGGFILEAEADILGFTHADVGAILAAKWELPPRLVEVIQHYPVPAKSSECAREAAVVNLADVLARAKGWGFWGDSLVPPIGAGVQQALGMEPGMIEPLMQTIDEHFVDGVALLELI